ncbi:MAG: hypothetical protein K8I27_06465 [Planctomycetes bacterium]|nr:hypothetical protein [Planctomycetota bacterium]
METVKRYRLLIPVSEKSKKSPIPDRDRLKAYARFINGEDLDEVTRELFERYDVTPPKHSAQAYSAFLRKMQRLAGQGDVATVEMAKDVGFPMEEFDPTSGLPSDYPAYGSNVNVATDQSAEE